MRSPAGGDGRNSSGHRLASRLAAAVTAGLLIGGLLASGVAFASSSDTWTGKGDGTSWTDGNNWSSGVPQDGDSVTIAPTALQVSPHVTDMPDGTSLQDLSMTNASLSGGAVTVAGDFSWSVSQGQNTLDAPVAVEGSATISGAGKKITFDEARGRCAELHAEVRCHQPDRRVA